MRETLKSAIEGALAGLGAGEAAFAIERPRLEHGDYATNAALAAAKLLKKSPREVAELLKKELEGKIEGVGKIEVAGAGFLNFWLSREAFVPSEQAVAQLCAGKTILVEYTQPNPFKPFHIGHLMSNTLGEALSRLFEKAGARVVRANYQGDVGPHVAKALYALLKKGATEPSIEEIGEAYVEGNRAYEEDPEIKKEIDALNKKVYERSDEKVNALYDYGRKLSLDHFEEIYKKLGTKFDHYFFESETAPRGVAMVKKHAEVFEESDGAVVYRGEHTRVFITSQGLPTYEAKDLGLAEMKKEKAKFDEAITVTANEQDAYFRVVFDALAKVHPEWAGQFKHVSHGMMRFASGKMSSRKGNVITGESLIEELTEAARGREDVAVGAIKYAVLKSGSGKDIVFDPEQSLSLEGDSGPYLQYARVRAASLAEEAAKAGIAAGIGDMPQEASVLERTLIHYPHAFSRAAAELEPHHLTTYLTELAGAFNSWYANNRVIGGAAPCYGVLLAQTTERVLREGLRTLGIPAPEKM